MRDAWRARRNSLAVPVALAIISSLLLCTFSVPAQAKSEEEWKERAVYQIVSGLPQQSRQSLGQAWPACVSTVLLTHPVRCC